tara:strand:- start:4528 stop:5022 length:495 start_codon:yes stop_codon:yes gene_type:complete
MEQIRLKKYCLIGLDDIEQIQKDLEYISNDIVNFATGEEIIIATFKSELNIIELEEFLNMEKRAYIVFEMLPATFSANLLIEKFQEALFGGKVDNTEFTPLFEARLKMENIMTSSEEIPDLNKIIDIEPIKPTMDELLDKISKVGLDKLSKIEKQYLKEYSKQQ